MKGKPNFILKRTAALLKKKSKSVLLREETDSCFGNKRRQYSLATTSFGANGAIESPGKAYRIRLDLVYLKQSRESKF